MIFTPSRTRSIPSFLGLAVVGLGVVVLAAMPVALAGPPTSPCQIGDLVWVDANANGRQDPREPGLNGVTLHLVNPHGEIVATTISARGPNGQNGYYTFTLDTCDGVYQVAAETPEHYAPTAPCSTDPLRAGDSNCSPASVNLSDGTARVPPGWLTRARNGWPANPGLGVKNWSNRTVDFGFILTCHGRIGDFVWDDRDKDGVQDEGEPGLDGVRVTLKDASGKPVARTASGAQPGGGHGFYAFDHLCTGTYTVDVATPAGYDPSPNCSTDPDPALATDGNCAGTAVVLETDDTANTGIDFGFAAQCQGTIGDHVWFDLNGDGVQDPAEPGLDGVTVHLEGEGQAILATAVTGVSTDGSHGFYGFDHICAGSYTVAVVTPAGFDPASACSTDPDPALGGDANCSGTSLSPATDDVRNTAIDFAFTTACTGTIGDFVWNDLNGDGVQDVGEPGIDGVPVTLRFGDGPVSMTIATGPDGSGGHGFYLFHGLCAGVDTVEAATPAGFNPVQACSPDADPAKTGDANCSPASVTLEGTDGSNTSIDFGFVPRMQEVPEGCSHGFWKQPQHFSFWAPPYTPDTPFADVFEDAFPGRTLLQVLWQGGGGLEALGRETVAALLNAAAPNLDYGLEPGAVVDRFNAVFPGSKDDYNHLKDRFEGRNDQFCPLGGDGVLDRD